MSWQNERPDNPVHAAEREEARDAQRFASGPCYQHDWVSDRRGGGVCRDCGESVSRDEL